MGIRESFEKHPPGAEDFKIHDFLIEEKEKPKELPFNPETEVTEEDWQRISDSLKKLENHALEIRTVFPDKVKEINVDWQVMEDKLKRFQQNQNWFRFSWQIVNMRIIFPEKASEIQIDHQALQGIRDKFNEYYRAKNWGLLFSFVVNLRTIFPTKSAEFKLNQDAWEGMKAELEKFRKEHDWGTFSKWAMDMKINFPTEVDKLGLDSDAWHGMKSELEKFRRSANSAFQVEFIDRLMAMKILAAHKVEVTDEGIECIMRPPDGFRKEKKPRPERRQF